mgnify:CR=1 FL=1
MAHKEIRAIKCAKTSYIYANQAKMAVSVASKHVSVASKHVNVASKRVSFIRIYVSIASKHVNFISKHVRVVSKGVSVASKNVNFASKHVNPIITLPIFAKISAQLPYPSIFFQKIVGYHHTH